MNKYTLTVEWRRGMDEDWDGWHYTVTSNTSPIASMWSSGPYPTVKEALLDAAGHIEEHRAEVVNDRT